MWGTIHATGAALGYAGFLFLLRRGGSAGGGAVLRSCARSAALAGLVGGSQGVTVTPGWATLGWLAATAAASQVGGWLLVALTGFRLSTVVSSTLLLLTPVGALVLAALVLGEQPTTLQLVGSALMLAGFCALSTSSGRSPIAPVNKWLRNKRDTGFR